MNIKNTYNLQLIIISVITGLFIYNRNLDYYKVIPRKNIKASILIIIWTYISFMYSPWFVILGLVALNILDKIY
jgi:hypothetical protein